MEPEELEDRILENFHSAIARGTEKEEKLRAENRKKGKPSVTSLVYECLRRPYYDLTIPGNFIDPGGAIRVWIGRKCHETSILGGEMELKLEWEGITGQCDEYRDKIVLDKKTCRYTPRMPYSHHITQLEYYKVLLEETGRLVDIGAIVYINVDSAQVKVFPVIFQRRSEDIRKEMLEKKKALDKCLGSGILPPRRVMTWDDKTATLVCAYCPYYGLCMREDGMDPRWRPKSSSGKV